jgi:diadenosine tetraphosphate (Ap4A) HIT family hydrolase
MKRKITKEQYKKEIEKNPNVLDYPKVLEEKSVILDIPYTSWLVVKNKFPYLEYEEMPVARHHLLIPKMNDLEELEDLESCDFDDIKETIKEYKKFLRPKQALIISFKDRYEDRSIKKFHIHLIVVNKEK